MSIEIYIYIMSQKLGALGKTHGSFSLLTYKHSPFLTMFKAFFRVFFLGKSHLEVGDFCPEAKAPGLLTFFGPSTKRCTTHTGRRLQLGIFLGPWGSGSWKSNGQKIPKE